MSLFALPGSCEDSRIVRAVYSSAAGTISVSGRTRIRSPRSLTLFVLRMVISEDCRFAVESARVATWLA